MCLYWKPDCLVRTLQTLCEQIVVTGWKASSWQHTHIKICSILCRNVLICIQRKRKYDLSVSGILQLTINQDKSWSWNSRTHTGPSLRCSMASSHSFLLAVSSLINCFCCSESWKPSSTFICFKGGSSVEDKSCTKLINGRTHENTQKYK